MARQLCICLYWLKFEEDRQVYFNKVDNLATKISKSAPNKAGGVKSDDEHKVSDSEDKNGGDSDSDDSGSESEEGDGISALSNFLIDFYKELTP